MPKLWYGNGCASSVLHSEDTPFDDAISPLEFLELTIWANRERGIDLYEPSQKYFEHTISVSDG
jgi:hypothetical protein